MAYSQEKIADGYQVGFSGAKGFTTQWWDLKNALDYSISCRFYSVGSATGLTGGSVYLQASNEDSIGAPPGGLQNAIIGSNPSPTSTAQFGEQPRYNGLDATLLPNTLTSIVGPQGTGGQTVMFRDQLPGYRWTRVGYTGSVGTGVVDIWAKATW